MLVVRNHVMQASEASWRDYEGSLMSTHFTRSNFGKPQKSTIRRQHELGFCKEYPPGKFRAAHIVPASIQDQCLWLPVLMRTRAGSYQDLIRELYTSANGLWLRSFVEKLYDAEPGSEAKTTKQTQISP
eukprot:2601670-Amphidinium_carterae.1